MPQSEDLMPTAQMTQYLQIRRITLRRLVKNGRVPAYKISNRAVWFRFVESRKRINEGDA